MLAAWREWHPELVDSVAVNDQSLATRASSHDVSTSLELACFMSMAMFHSQRAA